MPYVKNDDILDNADPSCGGLNQEIMPLFEGKPSVCFSEIRDKKEYAGFKLNKIWNERMCNLEKYADYNYSSIRKDANRALEFIVSFSHSALKHLNLDDWKQANVEWFTKNFNVAPDGRNNIISAILHLDERTPHIHFIVVPIDERGILNSSRWINGTKNGSKCDILMMMP